MATITGYTAARMKAIEDASLVAATITDGNLIFTRFDGTLFDAGPIVDDNIVSASIDVNGDLIFVQADGDLINAGSTIGPSGPQGDPGLDGTDGTDGVGVPPGGSTGQWLKKASPTDFDMTWADSPISDLELIVDFVVPSTGGVILDNIPQTFRDLVIVCKGTLNAAYHLITLQINDIVTNYSTKYMYTAGTLGLGTDSAQTVAHIGRVGSSFTDWDVYCEIIGYSGDRTKRTQSKSVAGNATGVPEIGLSSTLFPVYSGGVGAAITKLNFTNSWNVGSRISIYGRGVL